MKHGDNGFHTYRHQEDVSHLNNGTGGHTAKTAPAKPKQDWNALARKYANQLTDEARRGLARALGLPVAALDGMQDLGFCPDDRFGPCWTFPERDAKGNAVGILRRFAEPVLIDGEKKNKLTLRGSARGLSIGRRWRELPGPVLVVEGPSDVLAGEACGLACLARPSNTGGAGLLAELLKGTEREIIVVGENDQKQNGDFPGRDGAKAVAEQLGKALGRPVRWAMPPDGVKDLRAWVLEIAAGWGVAEDWPGAGQEMVKHLATAPQPVAPSRWPEPVPISALTVETSSTDWFWHGCIARRHITLFSALMKAGKTTLVSHLLLALQDGRTFCERPTKRCRTLVVTEESKTIWRERRDALGLSDSLFVMCRPMVCKPTFADWLDFLKHVKECATRHAIDLITFDTIAAFAPWRSENDSADVMGTVTPLNLLTESDFGVLLFHHHGKCDQSQGKAARGSTALAGAVDVLLELRRFKADEVTDRRRLLTGLGRFDEIPEELVIELKEDGSGYKVEGDRKAVAARELATAILEVLPSDPPGLTATDAHGALAPDGRPRRGDVGKVLLAGAGTQWECGGTGKKGDPHRFWRRAA